MGLTQYKEKRNFSDTPEPIGKEKPAKDALRFVIQKHDASSLHYDFRLEMEGVLKSWAVPKGPSLNPADKRLAMMVEDHPFDYRNFEGVIPEGNYGAGVVMVWDEGRYEVYGGEGLSKKEQEKMLLAGLQGGAFKFHLYGQKMQGTFNLMRLKKGGEASWLLIKVKDDFADTAPITAEDTSVKSGRTLQDIAQAGGATLQHPEKKAAAPKGRSKTKVNAVEKGNKGAQKEDAMPHEITPMLATLADAPFSDPAWIYEIKWDGYRAVGYVQGQTVELLSRNNKSFVKRYPPVAGALAKLGADVVMDGEIIAVDKQGVASFQLLQNWQTQKKGALRYYVFDLLWLKGKDLRSLPLLERKKMLQEILPKKDAVLCYSDHVVGKGEAYFEEASAKGLEGIMAKKGDSPYVSGSRTETWLKIKTAKRQEVVIAGFTAPRNSRQFFGALLLGVYKGKELVYVGHTGSGLDRDSLEAIYKKLQPLITSQSPFAHSPKTNMPATWVKPKLVCEIKFTEWTRDGHARHPIFMGLRTDKAAKEVQKETPQSLSQIKETKMAKEKAPKEERSEDVREVKLGGKTVQFTNLHKVYWPKEGFAKGDKVAYYSEVMPFIFPYLKNRPQSLHRHPNGIAGTPFFQKDMKGKLPEWMPTYEDFSESTGKPVHYLVVNKEATLLYMANLGCIELHPFHSRVQKINNPDYCVLDLDPHTGSSFESVIETAQVVHKVLQGVGVSGYCKTSGSSGLHIYIPMKAKYAYDAVKDFAEAIVTVVQQELPKTTSLERNPAKRKNKIYLDWMQNTLTQTAACAYSLRPKPGMPVSTPLHWDEVKKGLTPGTWNAKNILERLRREGDLFASVLSEQTDLKKALAQLKSMRKS